MCLYFFALLLPVPVFPTSSVPGLWPVSCCWSCPRLFPPVLPSCINRPRLPLSVCGRRVAHLVPFTSLFCRGSSTLVCHLKFPVSGLFNLYPGGHFLFCFVVQLNGFLVLSNRDYVCFGSCLSFTASCWLLSVLIKSIIIKAVVSCRVPPAAGNSCYFFEFSQVSSKNNGGQIRLLFELHRR